MECVIAVAADQNVAGHSVPTTTDHVITRAAKYPIFARAAHQDVVAITTQDDVAANRIAAQTEINPRCCAAQIELDSINGWCFVGLDLQEILRARSQTSNVC